MKLWHHLRNKARAKRKKSGNPPDFRGYTQAQELIDRNWGIRFNSEPPKREGEGRALKRLAEKRKQNKKIPQRDPQVISRQVRRQTDRKAFKRFRSEVRAMERANKRNQRDVPKGNLPVSVAP